MRRGWLVLVMSVVVGAWSEAGAQDGGQPPPLPYLLQLRPDQREAWRAYQDEMALERVDQVEAAQEATQTNVMPTPQRLQQQLTQLPRHEAQLRRQVQAIDAFYAQLSPDQRQIFDRVTRTPIPPSPMSRQAAAPQGSILRQPSAGAPLPQPGDQ